MDAKTLCLGVLSLGDASGYEIRKMFEEGPFAHFHQASYGSIYPALSKLLDEQLVSCREHPQDGRPDKKVYSLTPLGLEAFRKTLTKTPDADKVRSETLFMLFFADHVNEDHLADVLDSYIDQHRFMVEKLKALDSAGVSRGRLFVRGVGQVFYESLLKYLEDNRDQFLSAAKDDGWRDLQSIHECIEMSQEGVKPIRSGGAS